MRPDTRRFETRGANYAAQLGLGAAIDYALDERRLPRIPTCVTVLAKTRQGQLDGIPGVRVTGSGIQRCGTITFTMDGAGTDQLKSSPALQGINMSVSGMPSARTDRDDRGLSEVIRASVHHHNTEEEITALVRAVRTSA
ncbi:aminotransferase class V-fold PLP-dependent enzyme [Streptomyces canus]|uniref:aminotransferase class V-fold PLP-dependent enzyme n=1 Tax=Streptomyces canus TaxID=58343 RepID=UPI0036EBE728